MLKQFKIFFIFLIIIFYSCSDYQQVLKSNDIQLKYNKAKEYYKKGDYYKAYPLLEELINIYRGTNKGEELYFLYCYTNYYLGDYIEASFHFKNYALSYPLSSKAEKATFMSAYCNYLMSPEPSLDQSNTLKAIKELQQFINNYPQSSKIDSANALIDMLRHKLEVKNYNNAKLYYKMGYYNAAIVALKNVLKDFPETQYKENIYFYILKSSYLYALNSVPEKQKERIENAIKSYYNYIDHFNNGKYINEAENIYKSLIKLKEKINFES